MPYIPAFVTTKRRSVQDNRLSKVLTLLVIFEPMLWITPILGFSWPMPLFQRSVCKHFWEVVCAAFALLDLGFTVWGGLFSSFWPKISRFRLCPIALQATWNWTLVWARSPTCFERVENTRSYGAHILLSPRSLPRFFLAMLLFLRAALWQPFRVCSFWASLVQ